MLPLDIKFRTLSQFINILSSNKSNFTQFSCKNVILFNSYWVSQARKFLSLSFSTNNGMPNADMYWDIHKSVQLISRETTHMTWTLSLIAPDKKDHLAITPYHCMTWNHQQAPCASIHFLWNRQRRLLFLGVKLHCLSSFVSQLENQEICWSGWQLVWHPLAHMEWVSLGPLLGWCLPMFVGVRRKGASFQPILLLAHSGDYPSNLRLQQQLEVCRVVVSQICFLNLPHS